MKKKKITCRNFLEKCWRKIKAKSINFMVKHKISWRNAGEIPPGFLQEILQLIMEKNEKCVFIFISTVHTFEKGLPVNKDSLSSVFYWTVLPII